MLTHPSCLFSSDLSYAVLAFSPYLNKSLMHLANILDWYLAHSLLHYTPDTLIHWIYVRSLSWPHVIINKWRLAVQFEIRMCHVFLHCLAGRQTHSQQCCRSLAALPASATRPDNMACWFERQVNENEASLTEFWCRSRDITDLLEVGRVRRRRLSYAHAEKI